MGLLAGLVGRADTAATVVAECRRCGTSVDSDASACTVCDSDDIVRYEIE